MANLDELAAKDFHCTLGDEELDTIADLTLRLHQRRARATGALLTPMQSRPYMQRAVTEREGMRSAVRHVVSALVLLDFVEV